MPTAAPHQRLCRLVISALPLVLATLLTLVLGWSALHEGTAVPAASAQASAADAARLAPDPGHPSPLPGVSPGTESKPDSGRNLRPLLPLLCVLLQWKPAASAPPPLTASLDFRPVSLHAPRGQAPPRLT